MWDSGLGCGKGARRNGRFPYHWNCRSSTEVARLPVLVRVVKTKMGSQWLWSWRLIERNLWGLKKISTHQSKYFKGHKGEWWTQRREEGKDTQDGKGKDHQLSQHSRQTTLQPKSRRSDHGLQLRPRRPHGSGRAAMAAFPRPQWWRCLCAR